MKRVALLLAAGALGAVASVGVGHAAAADQAKADAAIAVFEQRVTDAGFVDTGPSETSDTAGTTTGSSDVLAEEPQSFDACFGALAPLLDNTSGDVEGQTARAVSDNYTFTAAPTTAATTGVFDMGPAQDMVAAGVITVDDAHTQLLDQFVSQLTSPDTAACIEGEIAETSAITMPTIPELTGVSLPDLSSMIPQIDVHATPDLGVGDASGRLDLGISSNMLGIPIDLDVSLLLARTGNSLVYIAYSTGAEPVSTLDPQAELQAVVDALA